MIVAARSWPRVSILNLFMPMLHLLPLPVKFSKKLAALLDLKEKDLFNILNSDRKFIWIKTSIDSDLVSEIKSWEEPGLKFVEEGKRAYPNQTLFSQVLGFIGTEGGGLEGLEKKYDGELKGEKQSIPSSVMLAGDLLL